MRKSRWPGLLSVPAGIRPQLVASLRRGGLLTFAVNLTMGFSRGGEAPYPSFGLPRPRGLFVKTQETQFEERL